MHDLTVRYNISENDARGHNQGALAVWSSGDNGGIQRANFYNNTVLLSDPANGTRPKAVYIMSGGISGITLRNNVLQTSSGLPVVTSLTTSGVRLEGNCYWNQAESSLVEWNGMAYSDLAAWRAATGQERLASGSATGIHADPQLPNSPVQAPLATSPVRAAGLSLQAEFNVSPGARDFVGNPTVQAPARGNIGAFEGNLTAPAPLPVELAAFTVAEQGRGALLRWSTATEQNNAFFVVESSIDGRTFTRLVQLAGHGTSTQPHHYQFTDLNLARYGATTVYYRLRQVDRDGRAAFSPVRSLSGRWSMAPNLAQVPMWPNPAQKGGMVYVQGDPASEVQLFDAQGRLLASAQAAADGMAGLSSASLAAGVYIVRCGSRSARLTLTD
jgi:hypothetical protein